MSSPPQDVPRECHQAQLLRRHRRENSTFARRTAREKQCSARQRKRCRGNGFEDSVLHVVRCNRSHPSDGRFTLLASSRVLYLNTIGFVFVFLNVGGEAVLRFTCCCLPVDAVVATTSNVPRILISHLPFSVFWSPSRASPKDSFRF